MASAEEKLLMKESPVGLGYRQVQRPNKSSKLETIIAGPGRE